MFSLFAYAIALCALADRIVNGFEVNHEFLFFFSLPLTSSNHSVLPSSSLQSTVPTLNPVNSAVPSSVLATTSSTDHVANAQSKRCRFALKDSSKNATNATGFNTSTSSNASTVIEQQIPVIINNDYKIAESKISTVMPHTHHEKVEGLPFKPPLMIEQVTKISISHYL